MLGEYNYGIRQSRNRTLYERCIDFEHDARVGRAAIFSGPVEVAGRVADHTGAGPAAIGPGFHKTRDTR
jgi:hypothetical protein